MSKSTSFRLVAAIVLCLAGAVVSGLLLAQHHGEGNAVATVNQLCGDGQTSGCEAVARSAWSSLGGVPLALLGVFFYLSLTLLLALGAAAPREVSRIGARIGLGLLVLGLVFDLFLLGVQAFSIHAYCTLCLATYALSALAALALWAVAEPLRKSSADAIAEPAPPPPPDSPDDTLPAHPNPPSVDGERRLVLAGWVLGSLVLAVGLAAAEVALAEREKTRVMAMIGVPAAVLPTAATPSPEPEAAAVPGQPVPAGDTAHWQAEAQRLQSTLDDPAKLEAYFSEKAQREFDVARPEKLSLENTPTKGAANAPVQVVEYSDFLCPFCRNLAGALGNFVPQSGNRIQVYFKNFPLEQSCNPSLKGTVHVGSCLLALGSICANNQGKFWPYHDRVFAEPLQSVQAADIVRLATEAGLNGAAIDGCLSDPHTKAQLAADITEGNRLKISGTPTVFINGKRLPRINDFVQVIDKEARKKGFPPLPQAQAQR